MSFPARYGFKCSKCGVLGKRGDLISWSRKEKGLIYHASCAPNNSLPTEIDPTALHVDVDMAYKENPGFNQYYNPIEPLKEFKGDIKVPENKPMEIFAEAIAPFVQAKLKANIDEQAIKILIKDQIEKVSKPRKLEVTVKETGSISTINNPHKVLPSLLYYVSKRHHVYLHGPAGSGKSTAAQQVAEALKLSFGYLSLNPQTPDSRILGFIDAGGTYRPTPFYNCYKEGGVFCIDEMDNASAALLTTLNSMLENGIGAFPSGLVSRHKDFVLVATGNTNGKGANPMFPERRPFDTAFSERFTFLFWDYDTDLERKVTLLINPNAENWLEWCFKAREYTKKNFPRVLVSPRAAFKGAEYLKDGKLTPEFIAEGLIFKGLDPDSIKKILSAVPLTSVEVGK